MTSLQTAENVNAYVESFLNFYCKLEKSPGYAVLLKGKWGCGKSWFAEQLKRKLEANKQKVLKISLNGISKPQQIQEELFYQLHPTLGSPGMKLAGKFVQGAVKGFLKIDLDNDSKDDISLNFNIPEGWQKLFNQVNKSILIFDDLERCQIPIESIMGYINNFVEQQGLKVIIISDESKFDKSDSYWMIKEKVVGKTYEIHLDLRAALASFINELQDAEAKLFLTNSSDLVEEVYLKTEYKNLRSLAIIISDFERIHQEIDPKYQKNNDVLTTVLKFLIALSIEVKKGFLSPANIARIPEFLRFNPEHPMKWRTKDSVMGSIYQPDFDSKYSDEEIKTLTKLQEILKNYDFLDPIMGEAIPDLGWWQEFMDRGKIDCLGLNESIANSRYLLEKNAPSWVRLYHFWQLTQSEFEHLLAEVSLNYSNHDYTELYEFIHVTGILMELSSRGLYQQQSVDEVLSDAVTQAKSVFAYGDRDLDSFCELLKITFPDGLRGAYGLGFRAEDIKQFDDFYFHCIKIHRISLDIYSSKLCDYLLDLMSEDIWKFKNLICTNKYSTQFDPLADWVHQRPVFAYMDVNNFANKFWGLQFDDRRRCFSGLCERYDIINIYSDLGKELGFLENFKLHLSEKKAELGNLDALRLEQHLENLDAGIDKITNYQRANV
ncbi:hypothetical protein I4641_15715 [Waterburya agarophytonicola K14]|uniref:KAP NTPase domain-containing protein n=1 Tax=Waterburya agarophytonicola KI4 TaxID=2874699 RepID=A0A964BS08_9CYAN|nr:P-loop NTPase fold protein [Waterburya agarophytonicola]MCC0178425.1 hypothetical protein [Waterburya agarophytonicola KI4]